MPQVLDELLSILDLEPIEVNLFRGQNHKKIKMRVFGGQVLGQALIAAQRTVEGRAVHSMHAYFLRPGDPSVPILYEVDRIRDGRSFTTRRVVAIQHGRAIFNTSISFQVEEEGLSHQVEMPDVPDPETLPTEEELLSQLDPQVVVRIQKVIGKNHRKPIEMRRVEAMDFVGEHEQAPHQHIWFRAAARLSDDLAIHQAILGYASDMGILATSMLPHGAWFRFDKLQMASLDHAMWFHRPFRVDEWLLYSLESPNASGARGFGTGKIFTREGTLVASIAQEGLIRQLKDKPS